MTEFFQRDKSVVSRQVRDLFSKRILQASTVLFCLIFLSEIIGCRNCELNSPLVEINIEKNIGNIEQLNMCDFDCEIKYVPLEGDSVMLKVAALSEFSEELILVSDRSNCLLFDSRGKQISKFGCRGEGPGEYTYITNIKFGGHNQIIIQDGRFFLVYNQSGKILRKFKPEVNPEIIDRRGTMESWMLFNDSIFIGQVSNDSGQEEFKAVFFNEMGKTVGYVRNNIFLNLKKYYISSDNSSASIYQMGGITYFKEMLNDTVFRVDDQYAFEPIYYLNLGKYSMPKSVRELPMHEMGVESKKYIRVENLYETSRYLFLDCNFNNHSPAKRSEPGYLMDASGTEHKVLFYTLRMLGIYDKIYKELVFAEPVKSENWLMNCGLRNDYDGGVNFYPRKMVNDSTLAMWVDAYKLREHVASEAFKNSTPKYPEKKKELEELANKLSDNDNPVLILCTFKNLD
jgi:hypothetical protein